MLAEPTPTPLQPFAEAAAAELRRRGLVFSTVKPLPLSLTKTVIKAILLHGGITGEFGIARAKIINGVPTFPANVDDVINAAAWYLCDGG